MGKAFKALAIGSLSFAFIYALFSMSFPAPQSAEMMELVINKQDEVVNIIGVAGLGILLVGLTFAIRQHQSPQGLNEKL